VSEKVPPTDEEKPPGFLSQLSSAGVAMYALLVLSFAAAGILCAMGSMFAMIKGAATPHLGLVSGAQVEPWRLAELRRLELLGGAVSPDLYYDNSRNNNGASGCLVTKGRLLNWSGNGASHTEVALPGSTAVLENARGGPVVHIKGPNGSAECAFFPGEDAQRFVDMLQAEARRK